MDPKLVEYLNQLRGRRSRQGEGFTPSTALADADDTNAFLALLGQSASKAGTLGGKEAGSNLGGYADRLAKSNASYQQNLNNAQNYAEKGLMGEERSVDDLYKGMLDQDRISSQEKIAADRLKADIARADAAENRADQRAERQDKRDAASQKLANARYSLDVDKFEEDKNRAANRKDKPNPALVKQDQETNYRYNSLINNAQALKDLVKKNGTFELRGTAGTEMDSKIYQMAVDFAKMVDPDSVAREGEVASAKKYMLPIRDYGGFGTNNDTAVKMIDKYVQDLNSRIAARNAAKEGNRIGYSPDKKEVPSGTAMASSDSGAPQVGDVVDGYRFKGGDPSSPESWEQD